jgi:transcriptional regulator with XRE-family HTH domain
LTNESFERKTLVMGTFSLRLRFARNLAGVSQRDLARVAGLGSEATVGFAESGHTKMPHGEAIAKLAQVLGTTSDWLILGIGHAPTAEGTAAAVAAAKLDRESGLLPADDETNNTAAE